MLFFFEWFTDGLHGARRGNGNSIRVDDGSNWGDSERLTVPAIGRDRMRYFSGQLFTNALFCSSPSGEILWRRLGAAGAVALGTSAIYSSGEELIALNMDGTIQWNLQLEDRLKQLVIGSDGTLFAGAESSHRFYAINPDGTVKWISTPGKYGYSVAAAGSDGTVYVTDRDTLYALDPTGQRLWEFRGCKGAPLIVGDRVYVETKDGTVAVLANATGPANSSWPMKDADARQTSTARPAQGTPFLSALHSRFEPEGFRLAILADEGTALSIFTSTNLLDWTKAFTITSASNYIQYLDPSNGSLQKYYRVRRE